MNYKKLTTIVLLFFCLTEINAQSTSSVFDPDAKLTWLGLDFSKAKFIGGDEEFPRAEIPKLISGLNSLMLNEKDKYDVSKMLHRLSVETALDATMKHNEENISLSYIPSMDTRKLRRLSSDSISQIISRYNFSGLSGTGLIFNVETFSKPDNSALIWVTFVDLDKKKVLFTRRMESKPAGFGLRNYWAGAIYKTIKEIEKTYYNEWSKSK